MATPKAKPAAAAPVATVVAPVAPDVVAPVVEVAAEAAKAIEEVVAVGKETIETVVKASTDAASKGYDQAVALTKDQVAAAHKAQNVAFKSYEDVVQVTKDNIDAVVKAGSILTKGLQDISKQVFGLTQESIEEGVSASKAMFAAKTLREVFDLQSSLAQASLDKMFAQGTLLSDRSAKLFEQAFAPINSRVTATVDKIVKQAA
jgi:phasin family protein